MDWKQILLAIVGTVFRVVVAAYVVFFIYNVAIDSYNFGYRVFADVAMEVSPGKDIGVSIVEGKSVLEVGEILEEEGLIKDANIFFVQEFLSEHHGNLQPGVYVLNTSMSTEEILAVMAGSGEEEEDDSEESTEDDLAGESGEKEVKAVDNSELVGDFEEAPTEETEEE